MIMENDKFYIPERILNMTKEEIIIEKAKIINEVGLKKFKTLCEEIMIVMPMSDTEKEFLNHAALIWGAYNQIKWERDVALSQLQELGISLGEKVDDVKRLIEAEPQWIPCSKRLPEDRKEKLVYLSSNRMTVAVYNEHRLPHSGESIGWGYRVPDTYIDFEKEEVIAWIPLPEPYKGE